MGCVKTFGLTIFAALVLLPPAALAQTSGLYQILSGHYSACCGLAGNDFGYDLPDARQAYIRLAVDTQTGLASMTFLGADLQTVFQEVPCSSAGAIDFQFAYGFAVSGEIFFHVDPGPPPYAIFWTYTVSNSGAGLRIDGALGTAQAPCADVPTSFSHSNVVAMLLPPPRLTFVGFSTTNGARLMLQGHSGHTNVIEASTDLVTWKPVVTNVMDYSLCPICPYFIFDDPESTILPRRFYRARELWE